MAKRPTYRQKWPEYAAAWDRAKVTKVKEAAKVANRIFGLKGEYQKIEKDTGVPWWMVACLHDRESGGDWTKSLAQGDPWNRVSTRVPAGRGPFRSFRAAAYDALVTLKGYDKVIDWRLEKALYYMENYNGWGYHWKGVRSPYLWAGTSQQQPGKYVADHVWDPNAVDKQLGCVAVLKALMILDPTIKPERET